tara:strand:- start:1910 stop:2446 length:537 start_codon:yes stop_codon:yes gene_type:complete
VNWETLLKRNIAVTTGKTKTVDNPLIEDDENCKVRFDALIQKMKDFFANIDGSPYGASNFVNTYSFRTSSDGNKEIHDDEVYCIMLRWFEYVKKQYSIINPNRPLFDHINRRMSINEGYPEMSFQIKIEVPHWGGLNYSDKKTVVILTVRINDDKRINKVVIDIDLWGKFIELLRGAL